MHEGPVAVEQQTHRPVYPQVVAVPLVELQGQVLTQTSSNLSTMSEPVSLPQCAPDSAPSDAQTWTEKELKRDSSFPSEFNNAMQNGTCSSEEAHVTHILDGTAASPTVDDRETCCHNEPVEKDGDCGISPESASEEYPLDLLRIVKHKPSAIVFSDYDLCPQNHVVFAIESPDSRESSSSTTVEGEEDDDNFPEASQYKEFLVSRRRRNLSRNRKCLRKRPDAQPSSSSGWQKPTSKGRLEFTSGHEDEEKDTQQSNGKQVRTQAGTLVT